MVLDNNLEPCDFVLYGTGGDLARRKLLPSLYQLEKANLLHTDTTVVGVARQEMSKEDYLQMVEENIRKFNSDNICEKSLERL